MLLSNLASSRSRQPPAAAAHHGGDEGWCPGGAREPTGGTDGMECHSNPHRATVLQDDGYEADREEATNATNANPILAIFIAAHASQLLICLATA